MTLATYHLSHQADDTKLYSYTVKLGHWLPRLTPWHEYAITLGSTIYVTGPRCWPALHGHEFQHVVQFAAYGWFGFLRRYVWGLIRHGYGPTHPLEALAIAYATAHGGEFADLNPLQITGNGVDS